MATADGGYEGGLTGGKFRKRPFRKAASATPYDRPPALDRALRNRNGGQGERNRWFSKIVDPASRLINYGASMFFSSVFRKRLAPAPPPTPAPAAGADVSSFIEETAQATDVNLNEQVRDENSTNPMPEVMQLGVMDDTQGNSGAVAISDLELLLKQKTFTRGEYDRLTDLMRSRTIDLSKENEIKKTELDKLKVHFEEPERTSGLRLNGTGISSPGESINVIEEEFASPMELAKSFMGSRSSQPALPAPTLPCSSLRETATLQSSRKLSPNLANNLVTPRSKVSFAGLGENGSRAPRTYGRSVLLEYLFMECERHGEWLVSEEIITRKDIDDCLSGKDSSKIIGIGLPAYCILQALLRSIDGNSPGLLLSDGTEITTMNRPKETFFDWFFDPLMVIKEQIMTKNLETDDRAYFTRLVLLLGDPIRLKSLNAECSIEDNQKRAEINGFARRLQGITKSISRYPTAKRRFDILAKNLSEKLAKKFGTQMGNGNSIKRSKSGLGRLFSNRGAASHMHDDEIESFDDSCSQFV